MRLTGARMAIVMMILITNVCATPVVNAALLPMDVRSRRTQIRTTADQIANRRRFGGVSNVTIPTPQRTVKIIKVASLSFVFTISSPYLLRPAISLSENGIGIRIVGSMFELFIIRYSTVNRLRQFTKFAGSGRFLRNWILIPAGYSNRSQARSEESVMVDQPAWDKTNSPQVTAGEGAFGRAM